MNSSINWATSTCPTNTDVSKIKLALDFNSSPGFYICKIIVLGAPTPQPAAAESASEDSCQTASIISQTIDLPTVQFNKASDSYPYTISGFQDTLDSTSVGTCGTKTVTLDPSNTSAKFLTLTSDTDLITFAYNQTKTTDADIGVHTVSYTVEITDFKDLTTILTGSCTFEI